MAFLYVKPVAGRAPRHETTHRPLPPEGDYWPDSPYTRRRLRDGDIVEATAPDVAPVPVIPAAQTEISASTTSRRKSTKKGAE